MAADEIAQDWGEVVEVARLIEQLFAGEPITLGDDESPTQTNCRGKPPNRARANFVACQISFLVSTPSLQSTLVHIANQCGSLTLLAYLHAVYNHIERTLQNAYDSVTATKHHLTLLENLYRNPPDNLRAAYARGLTLPHVSPPRRFEDVGEGDSRAGPSLRDTPGPENVGKVAPRRINVLRMVRSTIGSLGWGKSGGYPGKGKAVLVE
jgi:hypothetical protein